MTPTERVDALTNDQHREILIRMVEALEANGHMIPMLEVMADWSLVDRGGIEKAWDKSTN